MSLKKAVALASIVLALEGKSAAQDIAAVTCSAGMIEFSQVCDGMTITSKNWGDMSSIRVSSPYGTIEAYDDDNNTRVDAVTVRRGHDVTHFYRGRAHFTRMAATYTTGTAEVADKLRIIRISHDEKGFVEYPSTGGFVAHPSEHMRVREVFRIVDRLYSGILVATSPFRGAQTNLRDYDKDVKRLLSP